MKITTLVSESKQQVTNLNHSILTRFLAEEWGLIDYAAAAESGTDAPQLIIHEYSDKASSYDFWSKFINSWGGPSFLLHISGEALNPPAWTNPANYKLSFAKDDFVGRHKNLQFHEALLSPFIPSCIASNSTEDESSLYQSVHNGEVVKTAYKLRTHFLETAKDRFCNFVYNNHSHPQLSGTGTRQLLCELLSSYKKVDCPGKSMHNTDELHTMEKMEAEDKQWQSQHIGDKEFPVHQRFLDKLRYLSRYKFTIAGENIASPYYISEKIIHPLIVGSIPIYIGCKEINELVNPKSFINCNDYQSFDEVVELVRQIDNDPIRYQEFLNQPPFLDKSLVHNYSRDRLRQRMDNIREEMIKHQQQCNTNRPANKPYQSHSWLSRRLAQFATKPEAVIWLGCWTLYRGLYKWVRKFVRGSSNS